jgi:hypothetical protein
MENPQIITTNTSIPLTTDNSSNGWVYVGIGVTILLILIGAFVIYWFVFRKPPVPVNTVCSSQTCPKGQYCTSMGTCMAGSGDYAGQSCVKNGDCVYGYNCISQYCVSNNLTPVHNLPAQFQLMYTLGNSKNYYLDPSSSSITHTQPTTNFSYDHVNQILSINGGSTSNNKVNVSTSGALSSSTTGYPLALVGNNSAVTIQYPCGSMLSYKGTTSSSINVFFPQVEKGMCPTKFQSSSGAVAITFNVQAMPNPPVNINIQLNGSNSQIQSPQYQPYQPSWSSLNNNMQQQPSSNPLNNNNMQQQPSWSSLNNNMQQQPSWSSLNNNMQQQPSWNSSNTNNMQQQPSWNSSNTNNMQQQPSSNPLNVNQDCINNLPDNIISPSQNLFMQSTLPGQLFGGDVQKSNNFVLHYNKNVKKN